MGWNARMAVVISGIRAGWGGAICLLAASVSFAQISPSPPAPLNTTAILDNYNDQSPFLATDGAGVWLTAWQCEEDLNGAGRDYDIFFSRSIDNGQTWSTPALLNANGAGDAGEDANPHLTTDRAGNWVAVWQSRENLAGAGTDYDIFVSRSADNGLTWSAPALLNHYGLVDVFADEHPRVATDGLGRWAVVWDSKHNLDGAQNDLDIFVSRSTDNGLTWTPAILLNTNGTADTGLDSFPQIATDGAGAWVTVWDSTQNLNGAGTDKDIFVSRSTDLGVTWSAPSLLNTNAASDAGADENPQIATDGAGAWVAVWQSRENLNGAGTDLDIFVSRSSNGGLTWSAPVPLNTNAAADTGLDEYSQIATDRAGNWVAVWRSTEDLGGAGADSDIFISWSKDNGASWLPPALLNTNAASDSGVDLVPAAATDGQGRWTVVWQSSENLDGAGTDFDIVVSRFTIAGKISVTPPLVDFGDRGLGTGPSESQAVILTNTGNADLGLLSVSITGADAGQFSIASDTGEPLLAPAQSRTVQISFGPASAGNKTASLRIVSSDPDAEVTDVPLSGVGRGPEITVAPRSLDFGGYVVGGALGTPRDVVISNFGVVNVSGISVSITGENASDFTKVSDTGASLLAPGAERTVSIRFAPASRGEKNAALRIVSNDLDEPVISVPLTGVGLAPRMLVGPRSLFFEARDIHAGPSPAQVVTITNDGTANLHCILGLTGAASDAFTFEGAAEFDLTPGAMREIQVRFDPASAGVKEAALVIRSNDPDSGRVEVALSGRGLAPDISVSPTSIDFGEIPVEGKANESRTVVIRNIGDASLIISSVGLTGTGVAHFKIVRDTGEPSLPPTLIREIGVQFAPSTPGLKQAVLRISSNDAGEGLVDVTLTGVGLGGQIAVNPSSLRVGNRQGEASFSVSNAASGSMSWTATVTQGGAWLSITSGSSGVNGGIVNLFHEHNPSSDNERVGTVRISSSAAQNSPIDVTLTQEKDRDTDGDSMLDYYEVTHDLDPNTHDASYDLDGDGLTNFEEFELGTNPRDARDPASEYYAAVNGSDANNGLTPETAWARIQTAINRVASTPAQGGLYGVPLARQKFPVTIHIAAGTVDFPATYPETVTLFHYVSLHGGDPAHPETTVIEALPSSDLVPLVNAANASHIQNLTLRLPGGSPPRTLLKINNVSLNVTNVIFDGGLSDAKGIAISQPNSSGAAVRQCVFRNLQFGIDSVNSEAIFTENTFDNFRPNGSAIFIGFTAKNPLALTPRLGARETVSETGFNAFRRMNGSAFIQIVPGVQNALVRAQYNDWGVYDESSIVEGIHDPAKVDFSNFLAEENKIVAGSVTGTVLIAGTLEPVPWEVNPQVYIQEAPGAVYTQDFDNGAFTVYPIPAEFMGDTVTAVFQAAPGTFSSEVMSVHLDPRERRGRAHFIVQDLREGPRASFTAGRVSPPGPIEGPGTNHVQFTDTSQSIQPIVSWLWNFGDGPKKTSSEQNPAHTYKETGVYTVSLTVTDRLGAQAIHIKENYIHVTRLRSDINGDGSVNSLDVQRAILGALGAGESPETTDINGDGDTNSVDVQLAILDALL